MCKKDINPTETVNQRADRVLDTCKPLVKRMEEELKAYLRTMPSEWLIEALRSRKEVAPMGWCPHCEREFNLADNEILLFTKSPIKQKPELICEGCGQYESECKCPKEE